jgi:hypothetical protein
VALRNKMDFHDGSTPLSDVLKTGSSSSVQTQSMIPNQTASERMVQLLQKPKHERLDSDEEVFPGDAIESKPRTSLSTTPQAPELPIAFVIFLSCYNVYTEDTIPTV